MGGTDVPSVCQGGAGLYPDTFNCAIGRDSRVHFLERTQEQGSAMELRSPWASTASPLASQSMKGQNLAPLDGNGEQILRGRELLSKVDFVADHEPLDPGAGYSGFPCSAGCGSQSHARLPLFMGECNTLPSLSSRG